MGCTGDCVQFYLERCRYGGVEWGGVSLERDKIYPIYVVSLPRQCCHAILGKMEGFTVEGSRESCIAELAKG